MPKKHYIQYTAAGYTPASFKGTWDDSASAVTRGLGMYPTSHVQFRKYPYSTSIGVFPSIQVIESSSTPVNVCLIRLVTAPIKTAITLDGTLDIVFVRTESNAAANMSTHIHAWVTTGDTDTVRGTLLNDVNGAVEWEAVSLANNYFKGESYSFDSVDAEVGDRVVIELGYFANNTNATAYSGRMHYGSYDIARDGIVDDYPRGYKNNSTWTFSNDIEYTVPIRLSTVQAEVAVQSVDDVATTALTQMAVEVLTGDVAYTRLSQMAVEVLIAAPPDVIPLTPLPTRCQAHYSINLYNTDGTLLAVFDDFKPVTIEHKINSFSNCTFSIDGLDDRVNLFGLDCFVQVWRDIGDYKYVEFDGFHRTSQLQYTEGGHWVFTSYSRGYEDLLVRRCIMYYAVTPFTLKQDYAETVIKEFINENLGPAAASPLRKMPGYIQGFSIEADQKRGPIHTAQYSWRNLYEVIKEIAQQTSVDYTVKRVNGTNFEFKCYYPTLGSDKSSTVVFAPEYGNMSMPSYTLSRTEEVNAVLVLGDGQNTNRKTLPVTDPATMADSPWNQRETTHDSRNSQYLSVYQETGEEVLKDLKAKEAFAFDVMQTDSLAYGYDYVLGDICTVKFGPISKTKKIVGVTLNLRDGKEDINIEFSDYP